MTRPCELPDNNNHTPWVPGPRLERAPLGDGPLSVLRFAVKDLIDVAGSVTGYGNPDWAAAHGPAVHDAPVVEALRKAGARLVGKAITDEFAFSLEGENVHHGTPRNPHAPGRLPGGSSNGSAVAVAAGLVDFALGTDTGGSVRVPASFCGVFGFRPTHGAVSLAGVMPFAPSYDTVGWFANSALLMERVGRVLLLRATDGAPLLSKLLLARDVCALADRSSAARLRQVAIRLGAVEEADVFGSSPTLWLDSYAALQGAEIRAALGPWIAANKPQLGPSIESRFAGLASITAAEVARWTQWRREQTHRLAAMLANGRALLLPTTPGAALPITANAAERGAFYADALAINALASHARLPQLSLPVATLDSAPDNAPLGLSIIGARNSDSALLALAVRLTAPNRQAAF